MHATAAPLLWVDAVICRPNGEISSNWRGLLAHDVERRLAIASVLAKSNLPGASRWGETVKRLSWFLLILVALGVAGAFGYSYNWLPLQSRPSKFRTAHVVRGDLISTVNSTGTLQPVHTVQIGAIVSGPISKLYVDYNAKVKEGDMLAKIDPRNFQATVDRDQATLANRRAELERVKALAENARANERRSQNLRKMKASYISDTEIDQAVADRRVAEAQIKVAEAAINEAEGNLRSSQSNLDYTDIKSPVDGIIIDRKVDEGQSVAASFQTPVLFLVAPHMDERMHVYASVDEADIGLIRQAQDRQQPVTFTVDAYPDDLFTGKIHEIRLNPTTLQNVVTYTVVVETPNLDMRLLPGMTPSLSFQIEKRQNILKIPNAALRFFPKPDQVHPKYRPLVEGTAALEQESEQNLINSSRSAEEKAAANRLRNLRHVWKLEGDLLAAIEVTAGLSDNDFTELVKGDLDEKQELITGNALPGFGGP